MFEQDCGTDGDGVRFLDLRLDIRQWFHSLSRRRHELSELTTAQSAVLRSGRSIFGKLAAYYDELNLSTTIAAFARASSITNDSQYSHRPDGRYLFRRLLLGGVT